MVDAPSSRDGPRIDVDDSEGRLALWLSTADVRVGVVPALGGRVLSLVTPAGEHLFRNADLVDQALRPVGKVAEGGDDAAGTLGSWANWGGDKTWPAPQGWSGPGEWPGPPDPVLDGGPYTARWATGTNQASIEMRSADDARSGLRIDRKVEVTAGKSGYRLTSTFTNVSDRVVRWAIWHVVQLPGAGPPLTGGTEAGHGVWVGTGPVPGAAVRDLIAGTGRVHTDQGRAGVAWVPPQDVVGKLGFAGATGWVAHAGAGRVTALRFAPEAGALYPDDGSRVEVWLEYPLEAPLAELGGLWPRHRVVECEVLGPLRTMTPGSSTQLVTDVLGCCGEGPVSDVQDAACVLEPLTAVPGPSGLSVTGRIGAFSSCPVTVGFLDRWGAPLGQVGLGSATGGTTFTVRSTPTVPPATTSVVLRLGASAVASAPVGGPSGYAGART